MAKRGRQKAGRAAKKAPKRKVARKAAKGKTAARKTARSAKATRKRAGKTVRPRRAPAIKRPVAPEQTPIEAEVLPGMEGDTGRLQFP